MLSTNRIKFVNALKTKKFRSETALFVAEGPKVVNDLIQNNYTIEALYALPSYAERFASLINARKIPCILITPQLLARISNLATPNEVLAVCHQKTITPSYSDIEKSWSFALDGINDPGNLGTIIRTAHWFNIQSIFCANGTADMYNPKTVQASMGSLGSVQLIYGELAELLAPLQDRLTIAASVMSGTALFDAPLNTNGVVVLGSESHGVSPEILAMASLNLFIPFAGTKHPDSLNVAVSAGIIAGELHRRKLL